MRVGAENPGPKALSMLDLTNPALDWVKLGQGLGVASVKVKRPRRSPVLSAAPWPSRARTSSSRALTG